MKNMRLIWTVTITGALLAACAGPEPQPYYGSPPSQAYESPRAAYGVVDRIEVIRRGDSGNVAGTVIGAIVGGLIGHQIGGGRGQTAATIAGAAGGAVAGHQIEKRSRAAHETFRVIVRYDNGSYQTVITDNITDLQTGDRVRVEGDRVYRY